MPAVPPIIAVPTTAGTGSEVDAIAVQGVGYIKKLDAARLHRRPKAGAPGLHDGSLHHGRHRIRERLRRHGHGGRQYGDESDSNDRG